MKTNIFSLFFLIIFILTANQNFAYEIDKQPSQKKDNLLSIVIMVKGNEILVQGYCIYIKDGREIRKELEKDNAWGWNFRGDYIQEVVMEKISGDASFKLFIMEGKDAASGKTVFESESVSSTEPVIYERD